MSRALRGASTDASTIHAIKSDTEGFEVSAADITLPDAAAAFTSASTIEQWLENLQLQLNALSTITNPDPTMLRLGVDQ